jgi:phospholipid-transporting ATPase
VRYVKSSVPYLTLAIGDGANDKNMITQADVGVAVKGKEGSEAARVSDYVLGEFKLLSFLTLYYGREWYRKNSQLIAYNFFKNWFHVSSVIVYGAFTYFSGVLIFDIYLYEMFNLLFAACPIIAFALFDYEYSAKQSLNAKYKEIYKPGVNNDEFNQTVYFLTIGRGFIYGLVALLAVFFLLENTVLSVDGRTGYLSQSGSVLYFNIIIIINLRILVMSNGFRPFLLLTIAWSTGIYWVMYKFFVKTIDSEMRESYYQELSTWNIFFVHLLLISIFILTEFGYKKYKWYDSQLKRSPFSLVYDVLRTVSVAPN